VTEFKYLGYVIKKNGGDDGQIRKLKKKGNIVMRRVWGLGERLFKGEIIVNNFNELNFLVI